MLVHVCFCLGPNDLGCARITLCISGSQACRSNAGTVEGSGEPCVLVQMVRGCTRYRDLWGFLSTEYLHSGVSAHQLPLTYVQYLNLGTVDDTLPLRGHL